MGAQKIHVKFQRNCKNTGNILKISCVRCNVKFDIYFLELLYEIFFGVITDDKLHLEKCKKERNMV